MEARQIEEQRALQQRRIRQQQESMAKRPAAPSSYQERTTDADATVAQGKNLWDISLTTKAGGSVAVSSSDQSQARTGKFSHRY